MRQRWLHTGNNQNLVRLTIIMNNDSIRYKNRVNKQTNKKSTHIEERMLFGPAAARIFPFHLYRLINCH